jgi:hypothetical protein
LEAEDSLPHWVSLNGFFSITHTGSELSLICLESIMPRDSQCQSGWRILQFKGIFDFSQIGVLASVTQPLAEAGVSLLAISTYETDYILVQDGQLEKAIQFLEKAGHIIHIPGD